jgi:hypothetical protein
MDKTCCSPAEPRQQSGCAAAEHKVGPRRLREKNANRYGLPQTMPRRDSGSGYRQCAPAGRARRLALSMRSMLSCVLGSLGPSGTVTGGRDRTKLHQPGSCPRGRAPAVTPGSSAREPGQPVEILWRSPARLARAPCRALQFLRPGPSLPAGRNWIAVTLPLQRSRDGSRSPRRRMAPP